MWRPHDKGCKCDECKEAKRRDRLARIEAERVTLERAVIAKARTWHTYPIDNDDYESDTASDHEEGLDRACAALDIFEKKHGARS